MDGGAVVETLEAMTASVATLSDCVGGGVCPGAGVWSGGAAARGTGAGGATSGGVGGEAGADPLRDQADACLDGLARWPVWRPGSPR